MRGKRRGKEMRGRGKMERGTMESKRSRGKK